MTAHPRLRFPHTPRARWVAAALGISWVLTVVLLVVYRAPHIDDGYYTFGPYNFLYNGRMDARQIEPSAFVWPNIDKPLTRIDHRAYFHLPLEMLLQAGWYKVVGWGLTQQRLLSLTFGLAGLLLWYLLIRRLTDPAVAAIAIVLIAFDWIYLTACTWGRMDMMSHCFGLAAFYFHERWYATQPGCARAVSATFLSAAALVHPNGFLVWGALYGVRSLQQWRSWRWRELPCFALPCAAGATFLWRWIAYDPVAFREQMKANSAFRFTAFRLNELARYAEMYGLLHPRSAEVLKAFVPITFVIGYILAARHSEKRRQGFAQCLLYAISAIVALAVIDGTKWPQFGLHTAPWLAVMAAFGFRVAWEKGARLWVVGWLALYVLFPLAAATGLARRNSMGRLYRPAVAALSALHAENTVVFAPPEFIFGYRAPFVFDVRLGYISHRQSPAIAVDKNIMQGTLTWAENGNPGLYAYLNQRLAKNCTLRYENSRYAVYACAYEAARL